MQTPGAYIFEANIICRPEGSFLVAKLLYKSIVLRILIGHVFIKTEPIIKDLSKRTFANIPLDCFPNFSSSHKHQNKYCENTRTGEYRRPAPVWVGGGGGSFS